MVRRGAAAVLALVAGAVCGIALVLGTAPRRAELVGGIDGSLVVSAGAAAAARGAGASVRYGKGCVCVCAPPFSYSRDHAGSPWPGLSRSLRNPCGPCMTLCTCAVGHLAAGRRCGVRQNLDQLGLSRG